MLRIYHFLFGFESYKRGVLIHLTLLAFYSMVFLTIYYLLRELPYNVDINAYLQRKLSKILVLTMVAHLIIVIFIRFNQFKKMITTYFLEEGSSTNLAIFRIFFFFMLAIYFFNNTQGSNIAWTYLPTSSRVALPFIGWLVNNIPINHHLYYYACTIGAILGLFISLGLFTKVSSILLIPFAFYAIGVPMFFGKINHSHILLWVPIIFCLSPMGNKLSIDRMIKTKFKTTPSIPIQEKGSAYGLPFKILWLQLAIIYAFSGIIKLWDCGLDWALSDSMINQMQWEWVENYDKVPSFRLDQYPFFAKICGLAVIYFELLYVLLIFKPKSRIFAFLGAFSFHKITSYFMYIDFSALRYLHFSYVPWDKILYKLRGKKTTISFKMDEKTKFFKTLKEHRIQWLFICGLSLLGINFICSLFKIHSFPFSSYPSYSAIVKNEITLLKMNAEDTNGQNIDLKLMARQCNFQWESYRPFETQIATTFEQHDSLTLPQQLNDYWLIWETNIAGLDKVKKVDMFLETTPIVPEKRTEIIKSAYLGTVYPQELKRDVK